MAKVKTAVAESTTSPKNLVGYQEIDLHMIFDIKLQGNFRRKGSIVTGGNKTKALSSITYSLVVLRDSVRISYPLAALNELDIQSEDIENAYLISPCREKIWTRAGPEFRHDKGKVFITVKALYSLSQVGIIQGFKASIAYLDVWIRPVTKPDGGQY